MILLPPRKPSSLKHSCFRDDQGVVYLEFIMVLMPFLLLFFLTMQLVFMHAASIGVKFSASRAARAAAVVFPDKASEYEDAPQYQILGDTSCAKGSNHRVKAMLNKFGLGAQGGESSSSCRGGPRVSAVRSVAIVGLIPFGSTLDAMTPVDVTHNNMATWMVSALGYGLGATAVTFPKARESKDLYAPGESLPSDKAALVRVTHLFHCRVPLARRILCKGQLDRGVQAMFSTAGHDRDSRYTQGLKELKAGVSQTMLLNSFLVTGKRFQILRKESTFPMQGARYDD